MSAPRKYKPTLMEKLLGRNYKWWYIITYYFKTMTAYRGNTAFWSLFGLFNFWFTILVWYINKLNGSQVDFSEITTYLFFGNLYSQFINAWVASDLSELIKEGRLVSKLLLPTPFFKNYLFEFIGKTLGNLIITTTIFLLSAILVFPYLKINFDLTNLFFVILSIPMAYLIAFNFNLIIGSFAFWLTETEGLRNFKELFFDFLRGGYVPLGLITIYFPILNFQPFAWLLHHPMQIYLGKYSSVQTLWVFLGGIIWCLVLHFLAKLVFKIGLKKNESVGL
jgi:ABC-2 type transport system permease protein